jgi:hypothetical protein
MAINVIRYAIQMQNGDYMKQEWNGSLSRVKIESVENPIDADLFRIKSITDRIVEEVLTGNANLFVTYDEDNPPVKVVKFKIGVEQISL